MFLINGHMLRLLPVSQITMQGATGLIRESVGSTLVLRFSVYYSDIR